MDAASEDDDAMLEPHARSASSSWRGSSCLGPVTGQDIVKCSRKKKKCRLCRSRPIETLAPVARKEAQAVVDKCRRSEDGDERVSAER